MLEILSNPNVQWVLFGTTALGIAGGVLGSFALLRRQSLISDAMSHAALPGICIAFLIVGEKMMGALLVGAGLTAYLGTYCIQAIAYYTRLKTDAAIGLVLSVFFGIGIVLLTFINNLPIGGQAGLNEFIFGQAAAMTSSDVRVISSVALVLVIITILLFKELKLLIFDREFARGIGLPTTVLNGLLMTMIVAAVVIGLQAVGVVLMVAMLIAPAITARYWTDRLDVMVILSGVFGAISGILGTVTSAPISGMPTGPIIIVAACIVFFVSLIVAPKKGLVVKAYRLQQLRKQTAREQILQSLYELVEEHYQASGSLTDFAREEIRALRPLSERRFRKTLNGLERSGKIDAKEEGYALTTSGRETAHNVTLNNRYMQMYAMHEARFANLQMEKRNWDFLSLPEEERERLHALLQEHQLEPRLMQGGRL
ncbi:metal ABC transporter permease [Natribacillus halophilus]|uniref:Manganese transport system membrane protein MntC n=1 Tax=Natribacillus halophilus TaxID=549003 RepID=A0A1G8LPB7_9BACI|nr:metal ABC transporter permease [Natribacillus halophilus]SDI57465.1 manganese/zinc/iron transport system permease protein [Natribacillus halophilus]